MTEPSIPTSSSLNLEQLNATSSLYGSSLKKEISDYRLKFIFLFDFISSNLYFKICSQEIADFNSSSSSIKDEKFPINQINTKNEENHFKRESRTLKENDSDESGISNQKYNIN